MIKIKTNVITELEFFIPEFTQIELELHVFDFLVDTIGKVPSTTADALKPPIFETIQV